MHNFFLLFFFTIYFFFLLIDVVHFLVEISHFFLSVACVCANQSFSFIRQVLNEYPKHNVTFVNICMPLFFFCVCYISYNLISRNIILNKYFFFQFQRRTTRRRCRRRRVKERERERVMLFKFTTNLKLSSY